MKKLKILTAMLAVSLLFVGCSSPAQKLDEPVNTPIVQEAEVEDEQKEKEILEKLKVITFSLEPNLTILKPDSIGNVYIEATLVNTTDFPILSYTLKIKDKQTNETSYLTTYDTILPGDTSSKFEGFGPKSGLGADVEFLTISYEIKLDSIYLQVDCDLKLNEITYYETSH